MSDRFLEVVIDSVESEDAVNGEKVVVSNEMKGVSVVRFKYLEVIENSKILNVIGNTYCTIIDFDIAEEKIYKNGIVHEANKYWLRKGKIKGKIAFINSFNIYKGERGKGYTTELLDSVLGFLDTTKGIKKIVLSAIPEDEEGYEILEYERRIVELREVYTKRGFWISKNKTGQAETKFPFMERRVLDNVFKSKKIYKKIMKSELNKIVYVITEHDGMKNLVEY